MMKVDDITGNTKFRVVNNTKRKLTTAPSFTAKPVSTRTLDDAVASLVPAHLRLLKKLGSNSGELQNIIINAIGTGLVAPIFIKYNFMSKTDEDTRTYSAWRQPISAILAVLTQCGLTAPFYRIFENWSNKGVFGEKLNQTFFKDDYYITKLKKHEFPNETKDQIKQRVIDYKKEQMEALVRGLREKNTVEYQFSDGKTRNISSKEYKNLLMETIDKLIEYDTALEKELETTVKKRKSRSNYYRTHNDEAKSILNETYSAIEKAKNIKEIDAFITEKISNLHSNSQTTEMIALLGDIRKRAHKNFGTKTKGFKNMQKVLLENVKKILGHVEMYSGITTEAEVAHKVEASVQGDREAISISKQFFEGLKKEISDETTINEIQTKINEKKKNCALNETSSLNRDFAEETAKQLIARTKAHLKCYKQIIGIFVSLAILPFTCTLLNWVYPRFMDVFFPNLSSKKHDKEAAKLINQAPKKAEAAHD